MSIADNIKKLRESHGMSQVEFGAIAGVSDKAVSTWENGLKVPRMGAVQKLSDYFSIPKSNILDDEKEPTPVSEDGLDREAKEVAEAYKIADPYVQFSVRKLLGLGTQNMELQFAARKSDKPHPSTGPDTDVQI